MKLIKFIFSILSESALKSIGAVIGLLTLAFVSIFVVTGSTDGFFCSKAFSDKIGLDVCGDETKISKGKGEEKELDSGTSWDGWSTSEVNVALRRRLEHAIKLRDTQRPKQAEIDFTRIQADVAEYFGIDSIEMAEVLNHFGSVYSQLDMPEKRIELFEETVRIYVKHQGPNSIRAAENRVNMTGALRRLGRTEEAQRQLEAALLVFENSGYKGQGYGTAIESLANLEFEKGSLKTAKKAL